MLVSEKLRNMVNVNSWDLKTSKKDEICSIMLWPKKLKNAVLTSMDESVIAANWYFSCLLFVVLFVYSTTFL